MKYFMLFSLMLGLTLSLNAQAPYAFNYQGIARDLSGNPIGEQEISLRIGIIEGNSQGPMAFSESHFTKTNSFGLFSIQVGNGVQDKGSLMDIRWGDGRYFIQVEMDTEGGTNFQLLGTTQLVSVPYALYANNGSKWEDGFSEIGDPGIYYQNRVSIGNDFIDPISYLFVENPDDNVRQANLNNTILSKFVRSYKGTYFNTLEIHGYPNTDPFKEYMKNSSMIYAPSHSGSIQIAAAASLANIRFHTGGWDTPATERMRIDHRGRIGIGTMYPRAKLQVADGDIYIDNARNGVIMKSPNGNCWRMTVNNSGQPDFQAINCPN